MEVTIMNLVKWNPRREMETFQDRFGNFFREPFFKTSLLNDEAGMGRWEPVVDIYDDKDNFVIKAELPGVDKKDIDIDLKDHVLTLKGERSYENEVKEDNYYHKERVFGKFQRAFRLPANLDSEKINADFKDGVLKIEIPKPEEEKPQKIVVH
jgi:HSP20 family protein